MTCRIERARTPRATPIQTGFPAAYAHPCRRERPSRWLFPAVRDSPKAGLTAASAPPSSKKPGKCMRRRRPSLGKRDMGTHAPAN